MLLRTICSGVNLSKNSDRYFYANEIGLSSYSDTVKKNLKKVWTGQDKDRIYTDRQIDGIDPY